MRLIDADTFKKILGTDTKIRKTFCEIIDKQPTAYNVEAVVAELRKLEDTDTREVYLTHHIDCDEAIEIVKRGGVYETNKETHQST